MVDGSFFPSSAAVNPALTIMANALRVGEHMLDRLGVSWAIRSAASYFPVRDNSDMAAAWSMAFSLFSSSGGWALFLFFLGASLNFLFGWAPDSKQTASVRKSEFAPWALS